MNNFDNEVFGFENEGFDQNNSFDYNSLSGLGESNYENENLFNADLDDDFSSEFKSGDFEKDVTDRKDDLYADIDKLVETKDSELTLVDEPIIDDIPSEVENNYKEQIKNENQEENIPEMTKDSQFDELNSTQLQDINNQILENDSNIEDNSEQELFEDIQEEVRMEDNSEQELSENIQEDVNIENNKQQIDSDEDNGSEDDGVVMSDTPIEDLNKLTEYEEDIIEPTDINSLFDKVSVNVKDASDIFRKNTDLKQKIDARFDELKKLQIEIENSKTKQIAEVDNYKEEIMKKLTEKKDEIEKRLNILKDNQSTLDKEKQEFELYKRESQEKIDKIQKEVQNAYDDRREELSRIEDILRSQKDALDEERSQLSLDKIQYESDKNELANNLLKFNELVNTFKSGIGG